MATQAQLFCFDFTLKAQDEWKKQKDLLILSLTDLAKAWAFQLELSATGYLHFQGRFSLNEKKRLGSVLRLLQSSSGVWTTVHLSPTSSKGSKSMSYVMKVDTRQEGPWTDKTSKPSYIPRQVREIRDLRPWQQTIWDQAEDWDPRTINLVFDEVGNIGKSVLVTKMMVMKRGRKIPPMNDYQDLLAMVMDTPTSRCYLVDMPRALKKDKLGQFYSAIEDIKNGYAYDKRYSFKEKFFDSPNVWVFANVLPDFTLLSADRWKIWCVVDRELVPYQPPAAVEGFVTGQ
jgi:hypothetical protein